MWQSGFQVELGKWISLKENIHDLKIFSSFWSPELQVFMFSN